MKKKTALTIAGLAAALLCVPAAPAMADTINVSSPNGQASAVTLNGTPGKVTPNATVVLDGTLAGTTTTNVTPPGGSKAAEVVKFSTYADWGSTPITTAVLHGTSSAKWLGGSPLNASSVKLSDKYWSTGVGLTVSYPGGSAGITDSTVIITTTANNTWQNLHSVTNLKFNGLLFTVNEEATGTFKYGSYTSTVYAS